VTRTALAIVVVFGLAGPGAAPAAELVMFESAGCAYCLRWNREIGPIYPRTAEGKRAPLRRVDLSAARPSDLAGLPPIVYTPTFVLRDDAGREVGRIVGYSGDESFWSQLTVLMRKLDAVPAKPSP
jgi:hypothetical protein